MMKYAPYLHFAAGERFYPTDINYHIDNSVLLQKVDDTNVPIDQQPTVADISAYSTGDYFLNNTLGGFEEIADWFETLAKAEKSHAGRFGKALESLE